jgi:hypothetical protein
VNGEYKNAKYDLELQRFLSQPAISEILSLYGKIE